MQDIIDLQQAEIVERADRLRAIAVTKENCLKLEEVRTSANEYVKSVKDAIKRAKEEYLREFSDAERRALDALKPLEDACSEFASAILSAKKDRFKDEVMEEWKTISAADPYGNVAPFDKVYDPSWYGKPKKAWKEGLSKSIRREIESGESVTAYLVLESVSKSDLAEIEALLVSKRIVYRKEIL